jgi:hypothetical protein
MKKQTIEEAAKQYSIWPRNGELPDLIEQSFIEGAHSPEAKDFHTQGMYSEEQLRQAFLCGVSYADSHPKDTDVGLGDEEIDYQLESWKIIKTEDGEKS